MLNYLGVIVAFCIIVTVVSYNPLMRKCTSRLSGHFRKSAVKMSSFKCVNPEAITLVDFRLPAREDEVIQNLVNDEIISSSIIGDVTV